MPGLVAETIIVKHARGAGRPAKLLVPQGGFEPSTYRLRSDCSAVELLRRPQREPCSKEARPCRKRGLSLSPFVPAKAGTQSHGLRPLDSRLRGMNGG